MRKTLSLILASTLILGGCGAVRDSRVNPINWFGTERSAPPAPENSANPLIPTQSAIFSGFRRKEAVYDGQLFDQVTDLTIERVPGGVILRATGLAARQGNYAVQLTPANAEELPVGGVLTYRLEGKRPDAATPVGPRPTREVIAGRRLSDQLLAGVREIRVEAQRNALVANR